MQHHYLPRRPHRKLGTVRSSLLAPLATWLAVLALWSGVASAATVSSDERYILGVFIYGPNNQLLALKESLVLARLTNRTLVIPPLATHLLDTPDGHLQVIPITSVVDLHALRKFAPIKLWSELLDSGVWDGSVDVMVHGLKWDAFWTDDALKLLGSVYPKLNTEAARRHSILKWWNCSEHEQAQVEHYLSASSPPALPLASVFQRIVPGARNATTYQFNDTTRCMTLYNQVCAYTVKAPTIQRLATAWIANKLGGSKHFVLMHVRPYPDSCLYAWTNTSIAMTMDNMVFWNCTMPTLWHSMGPVASQILLRLPTWHHLVVMAHPSIRPRVTSGLAMYGLVPRFVDVDIISGVFSDDYAGTAVSFVEQEIAVRSAVFVGSDASSMTVNAMHERTARGVPIGRTTTFELVEAATGLAAKITRAVNETGRPLEMDDVPISAALSGIDAPWNGQLFDPFAAPGLVDRPWELIGRRN